MPPDTTSIPLPPPVAAVLCSECRTHPGYRSTQTGDLVCEECARRDYEPCPSCRDLIRNDRWCGSCLQCAECRGLVPEDQTIDTVRGSTICEDCRVDAYAQCPGCDGWNRTGDACGNGCHDDSGSIYEWDYKPTPVFRGQGPVFLGTELEIEVDDGCLRDCADIAGKHLDGLGYLKSDGSLRHGFEIVTHPLSYDWAMTHFPWRMLEDLRRHGAFTTDDTGLHVHVSRAGFASPSHIYRWMKLIYRNQEPVQALARRCSSEWAAFEDADRRAVKDFAKGGFGARHRAVNTNNLDTFELRIFASSLDPTQVQAAWGFTAASVEYTRLLTVGELTRSNAWSWGAFTAWVAEHPRYASLYQQMGALACVC